ncbi:hypothetical protein GGI43DRAFT_415173 [Trichoderma evansii]
MMPTPKCLALTFNKETHYFAPSLMGLILLGNILVFSWLTSASNIVPHCSGCSADVPCLSLLFLDQRCIWSDAVLKRRNAARGTEYIESK